MGYNYTNPEVAHYIRRAEALKPSERATVLLGFLGALSYNRTREGGLRDVFDALDIALQQVEQREPENG